VDFESGAYDMVTHLISKGHNRIAIILYAPDKLDRYFVPRLGGYKKALKSVGIGIDDALIKENAAVKINTSALLKELFSLKKPPTAIFCATDRIALDVIAKLKKMGKRVPDDVAVAGFDNILPAFYIEPALTTIDTMRYESGAEAVSLLIRILGRQSNVALKVYIKPELIIRESA